MKCRYIREMDKAGGGKWNVGDENEHPDAWRLVRMGVAEPADDECRERAKMSPDEFRKAMKAYDRLSAGIHPDDFEKFDNKEILGYDEEGNYIPGPNWQGEIEEEEEDDEYEQGSD